MNVTCNLIIILRKASFDFPIKDEAEKSHSSVEV